MIPNHWRRQQLIRTLLRYSRYWSTVIAIGRSQGFSEVVRRARRKLSGESARLPRYDGAELPPKTWHALTLPLTDTPQVSIVIPVYNHFHYTFRCLQAVQATCAELAYEVIVVDDSSNDETATMLAAMAGVRVLRNPTNQGFIRSCNTGARAARGEFLVFLNNDTIPQADWLTALVQTYHTHPDAGLVGARLIYPNGRLQEAGGIVWRDGSAWNYGRGDSPHKPKYSYLRAVDYCSGACLLIRREFFLQLGLFDEYYAPAYYEDTDLAFRVRAAGYHVYYQPAATIIHFEGVSSGTDLGAGVKQHQAINADKFLRRWRSTLATHAPNGLAPEREKERRVKQRALILDQRIVMPDHDSGSLRMFNIIKILQKLGYKVTFAAVDLFYRPPYTSALQRLGVEVLYAPYVVDLDNYLARHGKIFELVLLSRADVAADYLATVRARCAQAVVVFDTVDLAFLREHRQAEVHNSASLRRAATRRKQQELELARRADVTLVVSSYEQALLAQEDPSLAVALVSNIHEWVAPQTPFAERRDILFVGNFEHPPNVDAVQFFITEIWPLVSARLPEARCYLIGGQAPSGQAPSGQAPSGQAPSGQAPQVLRNLVSERVILTGQVSDLAPWFERARLSVAPLRYGAGVKGKINMSMSHGVPVVATSMAAEGMQLTDGVDVLLADEPQDFADQIVRLYQDAALWQRLSQGGQINIEQHFSAAAAQTNLTRALAEAKTRLDPAAP